MLPTSQTFSALPQRTGVRAYCSWGKITKGFQLRDFFSGKKRECEECIICLTKDSESLVWLIDEGLSLSEPVHKDWERYLFLQMYRGWCCLGVREYSEELLSKKANYPIGKKKPKRSIIKAKNIFTIRRFPWNILVWILWPRCKILKQ